jgi:dTMP kinase
MENTVGLPKTSGGFFLTFEGPEGSGKTTQIVRLAERLRSMGKTVVQSREPGADGFGNAVRSLLLDHSSENLEPLTELFMMLAQRTEHLKKVIGPALERGQVVLCDRYLDSSIAYQGYGRGLRRDFVLNLHLECLGPCLPHATILLDIPPEIGLQRAHHQGRKQLDRMEIEALEFHARVREGYLAEANRDPGRFIVFDGSAPADDIFQRLTSELDRRFPEVFTC